MLKPIKTFFNYLQKNANTSNIFRLSNDLNISEMTEEIGSSSTLEGDNGVYDDPLTDPLAIDDEFRDVAVVENIIDTVPEIENNSIDDFVFVDIEKLKSKVSDSGSKIEQKHKEKKQFRNKHDSDINGNSKQHLIKSEETVKKLKSHIDKKQSNTLDPSLKKLITTTTTKDKDKEVIACELNSNSSIGKSKSLDLEKPLEYHNEKRSDVEELIANEHENNKSVNNGFVISITSSEPDETDEVTDTSILLEEFRSDGSDSGLGLDTLRNISVIEKKLATLTPSKSSLKRRSTDILHEDQPKKLKQGNINFGDVTVFYFPRCQGFGCVPTQGGSTLGMTTKHAYKKTFSLSEHAIEQRRLNRLKLNGELNPSSSSSDESKSDDEISENSLSEADSEAYGFLQPVTARQRRAILKAAGVRKIDITEKDECRQLRSSREVCGCTCRGYCDPDTCECSLAGIKCQVDRLKPHEFPCGCNRDGCANVNGRIEFNPARVKTHFIHTIMRLELEKRHELSDESSTSVIQHHSSKWWPQMRMQPSQNLIGNGTSSNGVSGYGNYVYGNGISTTSNSQYPPKIPPISTVVSSGVNSESLDLHYAYRDDYANTLAFSPETNGNSFNGANDYYSNYNNYLATPGSSTSSSSMFHNSYHINQQTPSVSQVASYQQGNFISDCQYSNYASTNGSSGYRIEQMNEFNGMPQGYLNSYSNSIHNGDTLSRVSYQSAAQSSTQQPHQVNQDLPTTIDNNYTSIAQNINNSSNSTNCPDQTSTSHEQGVESNENLSEIIKKSIVESVTT